MISILDKAVRIGFKAPTNAVDGILRDELLENYTAFLLFPDEKEFFDLTGIGQGVMSSWASCALVNQNCVKITSGDMFKFSDEDSGYSVNTITALEPDQHRRMAYYVFLGLFSQGLYSVIKTQTKVPGDNLFWAVVISDQIAQAYVPGYFEAGQWTAEDFLRVGYAFLIATKDAIIAELRPFGKSFKNFLSEVAHVGYSLRFVADNSYQADTLPIYHEFKSAIGRAGFLNADATNMPGLDAAEASKGYHEYLGFSSSYCKETPGFQKLPYFACFSPDFAIGPFSSPKLSADGDVAYADFPFNRNFILQNTSLYNTYPRFPVQAPVVNILSGGFFTITYPVIEEV